MHNMFIVVKVKSKMIKSFPHCRRRRRRLRHGAFERSALQNQATHTHTHAGRITGLKNERQPVCQRIMVGGSSLNCT